ncbi:unnamed protein product [Cylindrotheca closterium]|uniref:Uncharacterized protein n=1 Tax=Cylindrotheca closterium TaxID=2856 RepID=A0AAD2GDI8_9STRA|nr:unnamed protein product [Cylindrotheca closterium]
MMCLLNNTNNIIAKLALTLIVMLLAVAPIILQQLVHRAQIVIAPVRDVIHNEIATLSTTIFTTIAAITDAIQTIVNRAFASEGDAFTIINNINNNNTFLAVPINETYLQLILRARPRHWILRSPQKIIFWTPRHLIPTSACATIIAALSIIDAIQTVANKALKSYSTAVFNNNKFLALPVSETFLQLIPRAPRHLVIRASREIIVWTPARRLIRTSFRATISTAFLQTIIDAIQAMINTVLESDSIALFNNKKFLALPLSETFLQLVPRAPRHLVLRASREIIVWTPARNLIRPADPAMVIVRIIELTQELVNTTTIGAAKPFALTSLPTPVPQGWVQHYFSLGAIMPLVPPPTFCSNRNFVSSLVNIMIFDHHEDNKQNEAAANPIATTESTDSPIVRSSSDMLANIAIAADKEENNLDDDEDDVGHVDATAATTATVPVVPSITTKEPESFVVSSKLPFWMSKRFIARAADKKVKGRRRGQFKQCLGAQKKAKIQQQRQDAKQQERMDGGQEDMEIDHEEDEMKMEIDHERSTTTDTCCSITASNFKRRRGEFKERVVAQNKAGRRKIDQQLRNAKRQERLRQKRRMDEMMKIDYDWMELDGDTIMNGP